MASANPPISKTKILNVLVIGANGYLGHAISRAFLRGGGSTQLDNVHFRVFGLIRRSSAAPFLAKDEIIPIVASIPNTEPILAESSTWDVIVTAIEPAFTDPPATKEQHWANLLILIQRLAEVSSAKGVRPLVLWSSGCKDYGTTGLHGDEALTPHTEDSPLDALPLIKQRTDAALRALEVARAAGSSFDVSVVRATPVFGYSGSYFGAGLAYAAAAAAAAAATASTDNDKGKVFKFTADAGTILHAVHVDDCAEGYVSLATSALFRHRRSAVAGEVFNISGRKYETLEEVGGALAAEYGFDGGCQFRVAAEELAEGLSVVTSQLVFGWSQWVASDKIRKVTGWSDSRPLFSEDMRVYRLAYEAAAVATGDSGRASSASTVGSEDVGRIKERLAGI
ncbi:hypothetical protein B0H66DRAFT_554931 [Apodospora peruviana]|uniref:NAD-dependent epimerase/dehydratase domain-containing protein n=1 Tax=Apodospora peruviana TaxID=516989 RepID=A0AAE0ICQ5_9PEZI|nr:hypothetical protein B0H66DRAFT_554931 [Apodospora peruviana]